MAPLTSVEVGATATVGDREKVEWRSKDCAACVFTVTRSSLLLQGVLAKSTRVSRLISFRRGGERPIVLLHAWWSSCLQVTFESQR